MAAGTVQQPVRSPDSAGPRVALLDLDPDLARHLDSEQRAKARAAVTAPVAKLPPGPFEPVAVLGGRLNPFGAVVLQGLLTRELALGEQPTLRLFGTGDFLHATAPEVGLLTPDHLWVAVQPVSLAILDDRFLRAVQHWPRLISGLTERMALQHDATLIQLAIAQQPRVEDRLVMLFGALAERWGRVAADGIVIPLTLTHEALGRLVGARRPTVTLALRELRSQGRLDRRADGGWLLAVPADSAHTLEPLLGTASPQLIDAPLEARPPGHGEQVRLKSAHLRQRHESLLVRSQMLLSRIENSHAVAERMIRAAREARLRRGTG